MNEVTEAFVLLQKHFYGKPSVGLAPWIAVDDHTGQIVVSLLNGFVNRCADEKCNLPVRDNAAYQAIASMVVLAPWNLLFEYVEEAASVKIHDSVTSKELNDLAGTINEYHEVVE